MDDSSSDECLIEKIVKEYENILASSYNELTTTTVFEHQIDTGDHEAFGRLARWTLFLGEYNYTIKHRQGSKNPADQLSRAPVEVEKNNITNGENERALFAMDIIKYQTVANFLQTNTYPETFNEDQRNIASKKINFIVTVIIQQKYTGPNIFEDIKYVVNFFDLCQHYKGGKIKKNKMVPIVSTKTFAIVGTDAIGPINPPSEGPGFVSAEAIEFYKTMGINHKPTTAYHKKNWDKYLWKALVSLRTLTHRVTECSPSELLFGYQMNSHKLEKYRDTILDFEEACMERIKFAKENLPEIRQLTVDKIIDNKRYEKNRYDARITASSFKINDKVLKSVENPQSKFDAM
ncbi:hypothetical protein BB560_004014 [Smittium megazygosporum]|uniref:Uncharacterized protein n=1 Tax=Smittium megazygosporum TaxID=133381 RepID=A0A2T9ZAD4_9FUNG|nr:hypothetical protein BB560_004014 [Smittium megazygosporum]